MAKAAGVGRGLQGKDFLSENLGAKEKFDATFPKMALQSSKSIYGRYVFGVICIAGIYLFFMLFGYCQESIFKLNYPSSGESFTYSNFLIFTLCVSNLACLSILNLFKSRKSQLQIFSKLDRNTFGMLILSSSTYILSMCCSNFALTHVNYPTQVLVKSAKMVLVIIGGFLIFGKRYPWYDYFAVFVVTASLVLFNFAKLSSKKESHQTSFGLFLLFIALVCDGTTGPLQDRINSNVKLSSYELMFGTNFVGLFFSLLFTLLVEGSAPLSFIWKHPETIFWILCFNLSGTLGQFFIFLSLTTFGSLYTSLFTTLRKASSTIFSVYRFGHEMSSLQWVSVISIFTALLSQTYFSHLRKIDLSKQSKKVT
ncbi:UDP-galactose transporter family protein [Cardiosporidium cionae]|uniref:UDP-galactose transporter family protein n=1 Tax=Cardiosporidium cionae TaxID=476202 RepID=A0ABQ7J7I9_9APIC|nr:UDP-galactose transporter family protein [Cardiosporidium cionae]|eukprot:KAF8819950.1 UDP-galactose transporter family protein [Cardiosporidium cionae]